MASVSQQNIKRQALEDERKKSYIFAGKNFLQQNPNLSNQPSTFQKPLQTQSTNEQLSSMTAIPRQQTGAPGVSSISNINNLYQQSKLNGANERRNDPNFPTASEIEAFQSQLNTESIKRLSTRFKNERSTLLATLKLSVFKNILEEEFSQNKPAENLIQYMFERFRKFKFNDAGNEIDKKQDMDMLDFLLAMNLLARIVYDKKLRLMFELCDDDDDGCMRPAEILQMLQRVERIFARECSRVDLQSQILINTIADKKAEQNFHFIMGMIKHQNIKKLQDLAAKKEASSKETKNSAVGSVSPNINASPGANTEGGAPTKNITTNAEGVKIVTYEVDEDNLITYREFISAVKGLKNSLYKSILPRTLSFVDVLSIVRKEDDFKISDVQVDDFVMFRYELNSIFRKHHFMDEGSSERFGGKFPLSKVSGQQLKDLPAEIKKDCVDLYRPPGIIEKVDTVIGAKTQLDERIWLTVPSTKIFRRDKPEERAEEMQRMGFSSSLPLDGKKVTLDIGSYNTMGNQIGGNGSGMNAGQGLLGTMQGNKKIEAKLAISMKQENPNQLNFEELFQENLPPEAKELEDYVKKFKDKGESKDKEIEKYQRNAQEKLRRVRNLVPEHNKMQISALRLEDDPHGEMNAERRKKNKAMNAPLLLNQQKLKDDMMLEQLKQQFS